MARMPARTGKQAAYDPCTQEYTAALRFPDGSTELLRVKAARNAAEALAIVREHRLNTLVIMVSARQQAFENNTSRPKP